MDDPTRAEMITALRTAVAFFYEGSPRTRAGLTAVLRELEAGGWLPIESAPKDGTLVILWWPHYTNAPVLGRYLEEWDHGYYEGAGWRSVSITDSRFVDTRGPTLWAPLPPPPVEENT